MPRGRSKAAEDTNAQAAQAATAQAERAPQTADASGDGHGIHRLLGQAAQYYRNCLTFELRKQLHQIGLSDEILDRFEIGFGGSAPIGFGQPSAPSIAELDGRLVFPVRDRHGRLVNLVGRSLGQDLPRFRGLTGLDSLWNEGAVAQAEQIFLCEDPIDAMILVQIGLPAVAAWGPTHVDARWGELFAGKEVLVAYHATDLSRRSAQVLFDLLAPRAKGVYLLDFPEGVASPAELFAKAEHPVETLEALVRRAVSEGRLTRFTPDAALMPHFLREYARRASGQGGGMATGFERLDQLLFGGLREGVLAIAGAPGSGKSSLLRQMADGLAERGAAVLFFSLEMTAYECWARSLSRRMGRSMGELLSGSLPVDEVTRATEAYAEACQRLQTVDGVDGMTLEEIFQRTRHARTQLGVPPVVFVDYLQRIKPSPEELPLPRELRQSLLVWGLKRLAWTFGSPLVVSCAVSEEASRLEGMRSVAQVTELEQSADTIAVLRCPAPGPNGQDVCQIELEIVKHRNGERGTMVMEHDRRSGLFKEVGGAGRRSLGFAPA